MLQTRTKTALLALCSCVFAGSVYASGWYEEQVPAGSDLYSVEFKWKEWPPGTYFAFWNGSLYPKGGVYYGGLPSGPGKTEKDYHPGLIWSFWNHRDYGGKIARAIYTAPTMYAHQYGGEGMCGGIAGDRLPWMQKDNWYRMLLKVWRPVDESADHSFIGWWCKDQCSGEWRLLGVFQVPCVATGIGGNMGFVELLSEKKSRRFLARRNGYHRHEGKWGHSNTMTVKADASHTWLAELSADKRVAEFMHSKNPDDTHNVEPGSKKTITVTQPARPILDAPQANILESLVLGEQCLLRWEIPATAAPQLNYTVSVYDGENAEGKVLSTLSRNTPFTRIALLGGSQGARSLRLTIVDIYGQSVSITSKLHKPAPAASVNEPIHADQLQPGIRYAYHEFKDKLQELAPSAPDAPKKQGIVNTFDIHLGATKNFGVTYTGFIHARKTGLYYFDLKSCDGSQLYLGGNLLLDNNGLHSASNFAGGLFLSEGFHALKLRYFKGDNSRYRALRLCWAGPDMAYRQVDHRDLFSRSGSPGLRISAELEDGRYGLRAAFSNTQLPIAKVEYFRGDQRLGEANAFELLTQNNIAKGAAVSHSGAPENGTVGWQSCDNDLGTTFFMSGQTRNWILFDLGRPRMLDRVFTRFYVDGTRSYRYTVELSTNKTDWRKVATRRSDKAEEPQGNLHSFTAAKARYIRLKDIRNSANASIHLSELMAFSPGTECVAEPYALSTLLPAGANEIWARATDRDGSTFDSNLLAITATNIENAALQSKTLGEVGLPMGLVNQNDSYSYIGEGRCLSYKEITGDFQISARLKDNPRASSLNKINNNSWIGLCVMDAVNEHWPVTGIYDTAGYELMGSADFSDLGGTRLTQHRFNGTNSWIRLERQGKFIRCYSSPDGKIWQKESEQYTRHLRDTVVTGILFRTIPYLNKTLYSAAVDHVTITPLTTRPPVAGIYTGAPDEVTQLEADPRAPRTLYARSLNRILRSKDSGSTWSTLLEKADGSPLQAMALETRAPYRMAVGTHKGVFMAAGPKQALAPLALEGQHVTALSFAKNHDRLVVAVGQHESRIISIDLSNNSPRTLGQLANILVHQIVYDSREANGLHLATQQGLYGSWNDLHSLFQRHSKGLNTRSHASIAIDPVNRLSYILNRNADDSLSLCQSTWGVQYKTVTDSAFTSRTPITGLLKLDGQDRFLLCNRQGIFRSTDGAKTFRQVYPAVE